ncbi:MAG: hypothetical protein V2I37_04855 [Marinilabiliaceae bacterium]|jgi:hypothetical protein|nr:hypothetical protein [Marinilabiliaceae bacterium]
MGAQEKHTDDLKIIRKIMEESSRFLSLSGLSGVFIGLYALIGAIVCRFIILNESSKGDYSLFSAEISLNNKILALAFFVLIMIISLATAYLLALKKSRSKNQKIWSPVTRQLLVNLFVPLAAGAVFIIILLVNNNPEYIGASMLIFYGLALFNAGKYTFGEVQYLGGIEIIFGLLAASFTQLSLIFWLLGFSALHILYGLILYQKYR